MAKTLLAIFVLFAAIGVSLTAILPPNTVLNPLKFKLDSASLKSPLSNQDLQLKVADTGNRQFAVQIGLYSDLTQASFALNKLELSQTANIFATHDNQRQWYVALLGPFSTIDNAKHWQQQHFNLATSLVQWPDSPPEQTVKQEQTTP
ncbi:MULTISPECIES: SPOR domain-containing protein [unclassified Agarivorans]|uniref:SPOR domain-containing protein n=1 Tax=unclassified Agarivorans TaxID=2636026 RepID=UPI003D7CF233